jgi:hypothetical protein
MMRATARVIARNGVARGTSSTGSPCRSAAAMSAGGTAAWLRPVPNPIPATPAAATRAT